MTADSKRVAADNMAMSADPVIDAARTIAAIRKKRHTGRFYKLVTRDRIVSDGNYSGQSGEGPRE